MLAKQIKPQYVKIFPLSQIIMSTWGTRLDDTISADLPCSLMEANSYLYENCIKHKGRFTEPMRGICIISEQKVFISQRCHQTNIDIYIYVKKNTKTTVRYARLTDHLSERWIIIHRRQVVNQRPQTLEGQSDATPQYEFIMMTSSNGNIFRVTGPLCGEFTGPGEFPTQRPVTRSFDVYFDLRLNKRLNKQP